MSKMSEQVAKLKKKQWYPIIAPKQFNSIVLGETLVYDANSIIGKTLSQNLTNLINDQKRQNVNIHFKVVGVDNGQARTSVIGYEIASSSVKRFVRRSSEKMDLSFPCETSDGILLRIKPVIVAKANLKGSVAAKIRHNTISFLTKTVKKMKYEEVINDLIYHKLQNALRDNINKIYPLKVCEIRYLGVEPREKTQEGKVEAKIESKE